MEAELWSIFALFGLLSPSFGRQEAGQPRGLLQQQLYQAYRILPVGNFRPKLSFLARLAYTTNCLGLRGQPRSDLVCRCVTVPTSDSSRRKRGSRRRAQVHRQRGHLRAQAEARQFRRMPVHLGQLQEERRTFYQLGHLYPCGMFQFGMLATPEDFL